MTEVEVKVIKPPMEHIMSGRVFRPSKAFTHKLWTKAIVISIILWISAIQGLYGMSWFLSIVEPHDYPEPTILWNQWSNPVVKWGFLLNLVWLIPILIAIPYYVRSIEYSVKAETGEAMPEVYVKKGIFTISRNHVPFRTITNISSKAGVFDRLFGIGSVHVETAGYSGHEQRGPEEILEGVVFYEEVRDYILTELRKVRGPYVTTTELPLGENEGIRSEELLGTLQEIRDLLKKQINTN
jgi:membrane protein YdbS with pleckstrin-like domain